MTSAQLLPIVQIVGIMTGIIAIVTFLWKGLSVAIETKQAIIDLNNKIGSKVPREGLLGDVQEMKEEVKEVKDQVTEQAKEIAIIQTGVATRRATDKTVR